MVKGRIYLAGPMTGYPDLNFPRFHLAAAWLREAGWKVHSPAEFWGGDTSMPWSPYFKHDLIVLLSSSDALALISGWERSKGASLERQVALAVGLPVIPVPSSVTEISVGTADVPKIGCE